MTEGRWQVTTPAVLGASDRAGVEKGYRSVLQQESAVGTTIWLHGAGREPAVAVGLSGHAEDLPAPALLKETHAVSHLCF